MNGSLGGWELRADWFLEAFEIVNIPGPQSKRGLAFRSQVNVRVAHLGRFLGSFPIVALVGKVKNRTTVAFVGATIRGLIAARVVIAPRPPRPVSSLNCLT